MVKRRVLKNNKIYDSVEIISGIFSVAILILGLAYVFFVKSSVFYIVERDNLDSKISEMGTEISKLESECAKLRMTITLETAKEIGFEEDFSRVNFANADMGSVSGRFSYLGNEI